MSKYYKKRKKFSSQFYGESVSYPSHKYSYTQPKHHKNRKGKKYCKYEVWNLRLDTMYIEVMYNRISLRYVKYDKRRWRGIANSGRMWYNEYMKQIEV